MRKRSRFWQSCVLAAAVAIGFGVVWAIVVGVAGSLVEELTMPRRAYRDILVRHFPHHVGLTRGNVGDILYEAFGNYLGMQTFVPDSNVDGTYRPGLPFAEGKAAVKA